jgi:hypothetical protein
MIHHPSRRSCHAIVDPLDTKDNELPAGIWCCLDLGVGTVFKPTFMRSFSPTHDEPTAAGIALYIHARTEGRKKRGRKDIKSLFTVLMIAVKDEDNQTSELVGLDSGEVLGFYRDANPIRFDHLTFKTNPF